MYGFECPVRSGCYGRLETHHLVYRSRGGQDLPENGIMLCTVHHGRVHASQLLIEPRWLHPSAVAWLAELGAVDWDDLGQPFGRHWQSFAPRR